MKVAIIVLFCLVSSVITFKPISFESPSPITISVASACDEFHGDFNCTCTQSVFNPCCPWWEPEKCPPPVSQQKKDVAKQKADWFDSAAYNLAVITGALAFGLPESAIALGVSASTAGIAKQMAEDQKQIVKDPFDPAYYEIYDPAWPSAEDLGLSYSDNGHLNNMVWYTQAMAQMADMIYVTGNRVTSCQLRAPDASPINSRG